MGVSAVLRMPFSVLRRLLHSVVSCLTSHSGRAHASLRKDWVAVQEREGQIHMVPWKEAQTASPSEGRLVDTSTLPGMDVLDVRTEAGTTPPDDGTFDEAGGEAWERRGRDRRRSECLSVP